MLNEDRSPDFHSVDPIPLTMPFHCPLPIPALSRDEFEERDRVVMSCAYSSQNELGRLCDERVYENDMAVRLRAAGCGDVHTQVPLTVSHGDFTKTYRLDLVADGALYELKTVSELSGAHDAQLLNYMLLLEIPRAKLLNFRGAKVQGALRATPLDHTKRRAFSVDASRWSERSGECRRLFDTMVELLGDWGAFLDVRLYEQALVHFTGGENRVVCEIPLSRAGCELGTHRFPVHATGCAFAVTAFATGSEIHESHLRRLLAHTPLDGIQWINVAHARVQFVSITR